MKIARYLQPITILGLSLALSRGFAQTPASAAKPEPDVLIFVDGEKLIGTLQNSNGNSVVFKSDVAGVVSVDWSKVQELRSPREFAAVPKNVHISKSMASDVPQGKVAVEAQNVQIQPANRPP